MSGDKFQVGDRVFAKMKGWPPWPAVIRERVPGKVESYTVYFYGTYETAKIKPDCIYLYTEESKGKYGKLQRKAGFAEAMIEIEDNIGIEEDPEPEPQNSELQPDEEFEEMDIVEAPPSNQSFADVDSDEGELLIDEGPPPPPVLTKREAKTPVSRRGRPPGRKPKGTPNATPKLDEPELEDGEEVQPTPPPPKPAGRRGSKGKRDSFSAVATPDPKTESTPVVPQPEIVSRSGRKIKPKRFADDEIQFGNKSSTASPNINDDSTGPPVAKRKRGSSIGSKAAAANVSKVEATPIPPPPRLEKAKVITPRTEIENVESSDSGSGAKTVLRPPPPLRKFDAKPTLTPAPVPKLQAAPTRPPSLQRPPPPALVGRRGSRPALVPAPPAPKLKPGQKAPPPPPEEEDEEVEDGEVPESPPEGVEEESQTSVSAAEDGEEVDLDLEDVESDEVITPEPESPATPDDFENGYDDEEPELKQPVSRKRLLERAPARRVSAPYTTKRIKVDLSNGDSAILKFNHDRPRLRDIPALEWDIATAHNLMRIKTQLEYNTTEFLQGVAESAAAKNESLRAFKQADLTGRVHKKIDQLKMEGELIEIIGEIVDSLNVNSANCDRAMVLLERLRNHGLNSLALKKHPEVVETVRKLQHYRGNASEWKFTARQTAEFDRKTSLLRNKAGVIYEHLKSLFCTTPGKPFHEIFHEEVEKFKETVADLPDYKVLGIWNEPIEKGAKTNIKTESNEDHEEEEDSDSEDHSDSDMDAEAYDDMDATEDLSPVSI